MHTLAVKTKTIFQVVLAHPEVSRLRKSYNELPVTSIKQQDIIETCNFSPFICRNIHVNSMNTF